MPDHSISLTRSGRGFAQTKHPLAAWFINSMTVWRTDLQFVVNLLISCPNTKKRQRPSPHRLWINALQSKLLGLSEVAA